MIGFFFGAVAVAVLANRLATWAWRRDTWNAREHRPRLLELAEHVERMDEFYRRQAELAMECDECGHHQAHCVCGIASGCRVHGGPR